MERTHIRRRAKEIAGQTQLFFKKEGWDEAFATHSHLMHNTRKDDTDEKSPFGKGKRNSNFGQMSKGVIALFILNEKCSAKEPIYIMWRHLV